MLTTMKYLLFVAAFITVFGVFMSTYGGADLSSANFTVIMPGPSSGTVYAVYNDNAPIYTRLSSGIASIDFFAVHHDYQSQYDFDFHILVYGDNGSPLEIVKADYGPDSPPGNRNSTDEWYFLTIMEDQIHPILASWPTGQNIDFTVHRPVSTTENAQVFAEMTVDTSVGVNQSLADMIKDRLGAIVASVVGIIGFLSVPVIGPIGIIIGIGAFSTLVVSKVFGSSPEAFIYLLGKLLTLDFPGVPTEIRLLIATPLVILTAYVVLIVVRSFIPTVGGGSWG